MKKIINARICVKKEEIEQFIISAKMLVKEANLESGCLVYKLYQEVGNQFSFFFYEEYENQQAVDSHNSSDHFKKFISDISNLLSEDPIIEVH